MTTAHGEVTFGDKKLISAHMNDAQQQMWAQQRGAALLLGFPGQSCGPGGWGGRAKHSPSLDLIRAVAGKNWLYSGSKEASQAKNGGVGRRTRGKKPLFLRTTRLAWAASGSKTAGKSWRRV